MEAKKDNRSTSEHNLFQIFTLFASSHLFFYKQSWDGEEQGLIGSTWDAETNSEEYTQNMIAYLNVNFFTLKNLFFVGLSINFFFLQVDIAVNSLNPSFSVESSASLRTLIRNVASLVTDPNTNKTLSNVWNGEIGILGSGSDYTAFVDHLGISSLSMAFSGSDYGSFLSKFPTFLLSFDLSKKKVFTTLDTIVSIG